ncbi:oxidoreductase [Virgisporangium aliadipatigenens]|uniref:Oxidoreductase n=1 Tax=Virgisporangium aliadipatigenens TaxID=741659 RepID=A0A8J3YSH7_9ACTN|nr:aldo/keto reductase [Virgisporangium aliadipatigenens]GIJ49672.1 oxidoreductase [Virgisporangium aliadipatigenens]
MRLSELGFGGSPGGNLYQAVSDEQFGSAVDAAWNAGVRHFDTAPHYGLGLSERRLGAALRTRPRDEYTVSTKVGRLLVPSPETGGHTDPEGFAVAATHRRVWDFSRDGIRRSLEDSLRRTGLDRFDIVYLHDPDDHLREAVEVGVPALVELRDEGCVGAVGAGMNRSHPLARFVRETDVDVVMCAGRYTLLDQGAAHDLLPAARERGVDVVIAGVYNSGLLSRDRPPADSRYDYRPADPERVERATRIAEVCERYGVTLPAAALAFVRADPAVASTVVGMRSRPEVVETIHRSGAVVPDELWSALRAQRLIEPPPA